MHTTAWPCCALVTTLVLSSVPSDKYDGIRAPLHPLSRRCSSTHACGAGAP
jgi:hypothetical protein